MWREENRLQQDLASGRDELSKKEQALRSMTGKVKCHICLAVIVLYGLGLEKLSSLVKWCPGLYQATELNLFIELYGGKLCTKDILCIIKHNN